MKTRILKVKEWLKLRPLLVKSHDVRSQTEITLDRSKKYLLSYDGPDGILSFKILPFGASTFVASDHHECYIHCEPSLHETNDIERAKEEIVRELFGEVEGWLEED